MKKVFLTLFTIFSFGLVNAQLGIGTTVVDAMLHIKGTTNVGSGTYMFRLEDGQQQDGHVIMSNYGGYATWEDVGSATNQTLTLVSDNLTISGTGGNSVTIPTASGGHAHENGVTLSGGTVRLGGSLTQNTNIDLATFNLTFQGTSTGDIIFEGGSRNIMNTNLDDDYVNFGDGFPLVDGDDGVAFTDSAGNNYTRDFALGYYNGSSGGSAFSMGSSEYIVDGLDELLLSASSLNPLADNNTRLGGSSKRWSSVYAVNGTIQTSDLNLKKDINDLNYGLDEIRELEPISFQWKEDKVGKTKIPGNEQETKIGFSAQQLLEVVPEVVQTHTWYPSDENGNFARKENENLGVRYSELIPITVKAIQERQKQIDELKEMVKELKKQNELLKRLIREK